MKNAGMQLSTADRSGTRPCRFLLNTLRVTVDRAPLFLPLCAVAGVIAGCWFFLLPVLAVALCGVLRRYRVCSAVVLCAVLAGVQVYRRHESDSAFNIRLQEQGILRISGTVVRELTRGCVVDTGLNGVRVAVRGEVPWKLGDTVTLTAENAETPPPLTLGMFDVQRWMQGQGIAANLRLIDGERTGHPFSWAAVCGAADAVRSYLTQTVMPTGTESDARRQVLCALVLGDKSRAEEDTMSVFRRGGCLHAFAVSGLHVGLVTAMLWGLLRLLRIPPARTYLPVLLLAGVYVIITGFAVPAIRAYLMTALVLGGRILRRQVSLLNVWSAVALLILMVEPHQLFNAGFQLSFVVYAAICIGVRICLREKAWFGPDDYLPYRLRTNTELRYSAFERGVRGAALVALWAWVVSLPITFTQFHTFNIFSFMTNFVITPILPIAMGTGMVSMLAGGIPVVGEFLLTVALKCCGLFLAVVEFCGDMPQAYLPAQMPRLAQEYAVISAGYGYSACQLGNPGLLIAGGSDKNALFSYEPALFHSGYRPAALLLPVPSAGRMGVGEVFRRSQPQLRVLDAVELPVGRSSFHTPAGEYILYTPPASLPRRPMANATPVVVWRTPQGSVMYVGDASVLTFENIPEAERRADVLILGCNPRTPVADPELIRQTGAGAVILLPSAAKSALPDAALAPARVIRMPEEPFLYHGSLPAAAQE